MEDTFKHKGQRKKLIDSLKKTALFSPSLLKAMEQVPRHWFVDSAFENRAYDDEPLPIDKGQTISQPFTVAFQTQQLNVLPGSKILEIGTGSGYQCAILCAMGAQVVSIERHELLYQQAKKILGSLGYSPILVCGDGSQGNDEHKYYDGIVVTAGSPCVPESLRSQLKIGGKLVIPVGDKSLQQMLVITRLSQSDFETIPLRYFKFVPLVGKEAWKEN